MKAHEIKTHNQAIIELSRLNVAGIKVEGEIKKLEAEKFYYKTSLIIRDRIDDKIDLMKIQLNWLLQSMDKIKQSIEPPITDFDNIDDYLQNDQSAFIK
ncbi:MAG: hypothetical protein R6U95_09710 [Bacteroidales bacterium]